ncbi:MAG: hypothetical protein V8S87_10495 [Oscillospiraceae bacterium]
MALGIDQRGAEQRARGADGADDEVLERRLARVRVPGAEGREAHRGKGHDLEHDVDVEKVAREHDAQHAAGEHQKQREVLARECVLAYVAKE